MIPNKSKGGNIYSKYTRLVLQLQWIDFYTRMMPICQKYMWIELNLNSKEILRFYTNLDSKRNARFCTKLDSNEILDLKLEWNGNLDCSNIYSNS